MKSLEAKGLKAMVLAAGFGERLRPHTLDRPKPLVPVAGRPMVHYPLMWLRSQGVHDVVINTHYLAEMVEAELGGGSSLGIDIAYSREDEILGTGGALVRARSLFGRSRLVLLNADTLIDADLAAMVARHEQNGAIATLAMVEAPDPENYTSVMVDGDGFVSAIGGRPAPVDDARALTFSGLSILESELIDYLPACGFSHLAAHGLVPAMEDGKKIAAYPHRGYWKSLDTIDRVREAEADVESGAYVPPIKDQEKGSVP